MIGFKKNDSEKEIELIATIADFNQEFVKNTTPSLKPVYTLKDTQNAMAKKSNLLKELINFNIYAYKDFTNKRLYSTILKWRKDIRNTLFTSIQIDNAMLNGTARSDPSKTKQLIDNLGNSWKSKTKALEKQTKKAVKRYTAQHGHGLPQDILAFSVRQYTNKPNNKKI